MACLCLLLCGSSLRAQGTHLVSITVFDMVRFIPAGAGNTKTIPCRKPAHAVHPCGRREHNYFLCVLLA